MNTLSQTKYCLCVIVYDYFALILFCIEPFYQIYRRSKLAFWDILSLKSISFPNFGFKLPRFYNKRIFAKGPGTWGAYLKFYSFYTYTHSPIRA